MLPNSKSKDGSLKSVHAEYAKYVWGTYGLNNIKNYFLVK